MKSYVWNEEKNRLLQNERGISFEDIVDAISNGDLLDSIKNPSSEKYSNQSVFIVNVKGYVYCVPYVEDESIIFLKTIFPSRKMKKKIFRRLAVMQNLNFDNMNTEKINAVLNLDQYEQELLESIENEDWVSISDSKSEIKRFQDIAQRQISIQRIELQMSIQDSDKIYSLANQHGLSMSSFAQNIIHKYLNGELIEKI